MIVETKRAHAADKSLRIETKYGSAYGVHPYDTEIPEREAHQMAAVQALKWAGVEDFDLDKFEARGVGEYNFHFKRVE